MSLFIDIEDQINKNSDFIENSCIPSSNKTFLSVIVFFPLHYRMSVLQIILICARTINKMDSALKPPRNCPICYPSTKQQRIIVKTLLKQIQHLLAISCNLPPQTPPCSQYEAFSQLFKVIRQQSNRSQVDCNPCRHQKWIRFLRNSHYTSQQLSAICDTVFQKLSERCFHLWLIEAQVKNVANTITNKSFLPFPKSRLTETSLREEPAQTSHHQEGEEGSFLSRGFGDGEGAAGRLGEGLVFFNTLEGRQGGKQEGERVQMGELSNLGLYYTFPYFFEANH